LADITDILNRINSGDTSAIGELVSAVYGDLRDVAHRLMKIERNGQMLQTTALVHEAYLRLVDQNRVRWESRAHFFGAAAQTMRRILVDEARKRLTAKRGGGSDHDSLDTVLTIAFEPDLDVIALDGALDALAAMDPERARVVELRFFAGLSIDETAALLGQSPSAINRDWTFARAWLFRKLSGENGAGSRHE